MDLIPMQTDLDTSPVQQFSVFLPNRPGTLLSLTRLMTDHHIHILGLSVQDSSDMTLVRMVVTDPETLHTLFIEKGIAFGMHPVLVLELDSGLMGLPTTLSTLLMGEINLHFCYPLLCRPHDHALIAMAVDDIEVAASIFHNAGMKMLSQNELSR